MNKRQQKKEYKKPRCANCVHFELEFERATYSYNEWCREFKDQPKYITYEKNKCKAYKFGNINQVGDDICFD